MKAQRTTRYQLLLLFIASVVALTMYPIKSQAQIVGSLEADIPFQFHVGNTKLPPGKYTIRMLDDSELKIMEISSADESVSALFEVRSAQAKSTPGKSELIFDKYGHRYFLERLFDESDPNGSAVVKSGYEKGMAEAASEGEEHVPARHRGTSS
ncbi:MAG: hypothetical protein WCC37_04210 [Candidatus Sulfotelmatobacter sp.]|jgi:hypothetical protein